LLICKGCGGSPTALMPKLQRIWSRRNLNIRNKNTLRANYRPNYLSRNDHDWKIRNRRQRTDIGKYSFVNRTIRLWNRLPAEILGALPCKPSAFRKRVRKVINVVN
jgi:hypothetical protein